MSAGVAPRIRDLISWWRVVGFMPRSLNLGQKAFTAHGIEGWVSPGASLGAVTKREITAPAGS
jgi:hypothetical protein